MYQKSISIIYYLLVFVTINRWEVSSICSIIHLLILCLEFMSFIDFMFSFIFIIDASSPLSSSFKLYLQSNGQIIYQQLRILHAHNVNAVCYKLFISAPDLTKRIDKWEKTWPRGNRWLIDSLWLEKRIFNKFKVATQWVERPSKYKLGMNLN